MYRSVELYRQLVNKPLKYPICIPSYDRPYSPFIKWVQKPVFDVPKENLFMFIRNTPEQIEMYKPLSKWVNLVLIPATTKDIGETRAHIMRWAVKKGHSLIFMLDDRVNGIWWLSPINRNGKQYMDVDEWSTPNQAFKIWAEQHKQAGMVMTGLSDKGFHWMPEHVNYPLVPLNQGVPSVCIALSPLELCKNGVEYHSIITHGVEDLGFVYQLLQKRLPFCKCTDICYSQAAPLSTGGNTSVHSGLTRNERLDILKKKFWETQLGIPWGTKHPGFRIIQRKKESNIIAVNLKYWREFYEHTE